jgi:hypothetical protein
VYTSEIEQPLAAPSAVRVAAAFIDAVESGRLDLPLPGSGRTGERWAVLADLAEEDLSLARLAEGHADALAILTELGAAPPAGRRWGVWARPARGADRPPGGPRLAARRCQAVLLGRALGHRRAGDRGRVRR